jgi:hypothetical protein
VFETEFYYVKKLRLEVKEKSCRFKLHLSEEIFKTNKENMPCLIFNLVIYLEISK